MITTKDIQNIGWKHYGTYGNGGSKKFMKGKYPFAIINNSDNFIYKQSKDIRLHEIEIKELINMKFVTRYKGIPSDIKELKRKLLELGIK